MESTSSDSSTSVWAESSGSARPLGWRIEQQIQPKIGIAWGLNCGRMVGPYPGAVTPGPWDAEEDKITRDRASGSTEEKHTSGLMNGIAVGRSEGTRGRRRHRTARPKTNRSASVVGSSIPRTSPTSLPCFWALWWMSTTRNAAGRPTIPQSAICSANHPGRRADPFGPSPSGSGRPSRIRLSQ